ncbi:MAG: histidine kinase [Acidothermus sp.]|nr:histidine kinase [Acidothermus sp.]
MVADAPLWFAAASVLGIIAAAFRYGLRGGRDLGTSSQRATYQVLRTANLAAPPLRTGLTATSAQQAVAPLRSLLQTRGIVIADPEGVVASEGVDDVHRRLLAPALRRTIGSGRPEVLSRDDLNCGEGTCELQTAVVVPLSVAGTVLGALAAVDATARAGLLRLSGEVARFVSTQLELAELDRSRERAIRAELRFLRAQISPHFVYNALTAIESFVRSDPERARRLLIGFADFTRYCFRSHGHFTTMAEELRLVEIYLELEQARFGNRFAVTLRVAPEVLPVRVPSLVLQPIVENALRHGLEPKQSGRLDITIEDADTEAVVCVEDDGVGADPQRLRRILAGTIDDEPVGLRNVDERLRTVFGDERGLVIETAPGAGTKVTFRVPKYHAAILTGASR